MDDQRLRHGVLSPHARNHHKRFAELSEVLDLGSLGSSVRLTFPPTNKANCTGADDSVFHIKNRKKKENAAKEPIRAFSMEVYI